MKKIIILVVLVLGVGFWAKSLLKEEKKVQVKTAVDSDRDFAIKDFSKVNKIYLLKRNGKKVKLEKMAEDHWIIDDKYKASNILVNLLARTMKNIQVYYKINEAAFDNVVKQLATNNIKVEAYNENNKLIKCYYVGNATLDGEGSFMIMENENTPYAVHDPKKVGSLGPIFGIWGDDWIDKAIYKLDPKDITKVSIEYPAYANRSFELERKDGGFIVSKLDGSSDPNTKLQSDVVIENYLDVYKSHIAEKIVNDKRNSPFLASIDPFCTISTWDSKGAKTTKIFYPTELSLAKEKPETYIQKYYIDNGDGLMMKGQHRILKPLFVSYDFFIKR